MRKDLNQLCCLTTSIFFEAINRETLIAEAQLHGFPLVILRASLAAYAAPRMITLDGRAAKEVYARDGIMPGCTFATTYVKLFYMRRLDTLVAALPPEVDVNMYVDDLAIGAAGEANALVDTMVAARKAAIAALTVDLGCKIAESKSRVVASSGKIARSIANKLGINHAIRRSAPNLGVDTTAGARRRVIRTGSSSRKLRFANCQRRGVKLARVARLLGGRAIKFFTAGIAPEANYGSEVRGPAIWRPPN